MVSFKKDQFSKGNDLQVSISEFNQNVPFLLKDFSPALREKARSLREKDRS